MKAFLLHAERDFHGGAKRPPNEAQLFQDLELGTLVGAMAQHDELIDRVARTALVTSFDLDVEEVVYRQEALRDCIAHPDVVRQLYQLVGEALAKERKDFWLLGSKYPGSVLSHGVGVLQLFVGYLRQMRDLATQHRSAFKSPAFKRFFSTLESELTEDYLHAVEAELKELKFNDGMLMSASLGKDAKGLNYILRKPDKRPGFFERLFDSHSEAFTYRLHPRDEAGAQALYKLNERGINLVANAVGQSADHVSDFLKRVLMELAFYVGCLNLHARLSEKGEPVCFPSPYPLGERRHACRGLYDVCLSLTIKPRAVGNDLEGDGKLIVVITGANSGGKSTFLRSIGLAQLLFQAGMFVPAESFSANLVDGVFTHYKREEDKAMKSGKFDEELNRMDAVVRQLTSRPFVLFNESFAATNDREGSEIAMQIVRALTESAVKVFFVTHLYEFARDVRTRLEGISVFLRAERHEDGSRPFKLVTGEPLQTSYGPDLYATIFGEDASAATHKAVG